MSGAVLWEGIVGQREVCWAVAVGGRGYRVSGGRAVDLFLRVGAAGPRRKRRGV